MKNEVTIKIQFKLVFLIAIFSTLFVMIICLYAAKGSQEETICAVVLEAIILFGCIIFELYYLTFKITVFDDYFAVRKFFKTKNYKIKDITDLEYIRNLVGNYNYIVNLAKEKLK